MFKRLLRLLWITLSILLLLIIGVMIWAYAPDKSIEELTEKYAYDNSQFIEVDEMNVHYRINGTGSPIVLIHGTAASLHTWEQWANELQDSFQVISLDLPAFGLTGPNPDGIYNIEYYASFLDKFLRQLEIDTFYLAGNSLGGAIAWRYTTLYPNKVKKLILIDAAGYPLNKAPSLPFNLAKNKILAPIMLHFTPKILIKNSIIEVYGNDSLVTDAVVNRYYDMTLRAGNRQAFIDRTRNGSYSDPKFIKDIKVPTLIQWGSGDVWIPVENAKNFERDIENSKVIIYEKAGHIPMEEIPILSVTDAKKFLLE